MNLDLKTERLDNDRIKISWNDARRLDFKRGAKDSFGYLAGIFFIVSAATLLLLGLRDDVISMGTFAVLLIVVLFAVVKITDIPTWSFPKRNAVIVKRSGIEHGSTAFTYDRISRIEYGKKSQWSSVPYGTFDYTEIRIWFGDKSFHVIARNSWEQRVNHEIKGTIDEAVAMMTRPQGTQQNRAHDTQQDAPQAPKRNKFGMPDY